MQKTLDLNPGSGQRPPAERSRWLNERLLGAYRFLKMFRGAAPLVDGQYLFGLSKIVRIPAIFRQNSVTFLQNPATFRQYLDIFAKILETWTIKKN